MWNTLWPAPSPFSCAIRMPGGSNAFLTARAMRCVVRMVAASDVGVQVEEVLGLGLRNHQRVARRLWHHVHERQRLRVLVQLVRWNLASQDSREYVALVVGHGRSPWLVSWPSIASVRNQGTFPYFGEGSVPSPI